MQKCENRSSRKYQAYKQYWHGHRGFLDADVMNAARPQLWTVLPARPGRLVGGNV